MSVRRACLGAALFALLWIPWPGWGQAYPFLFRSAATTAFALAGDGSVSVRARDPRAPGALDSELFVRDGPGTWRYALDVRLLGLLPLALLAALFAAAPPARGRRSRDLFLGLVLVHAYVLARLGLIYAFALTRHLAEGRCPAAHARLLHSPGVVSALRSLARIDASPVVYVALPLLIWGLVRLLPEPDARGVGNTWGRGLTGGRAGT